MYFSSSNPFGKNRRNFRRHRTTFSVTLPLSGKFEILLFAVPAIIVDLLSLACMDFSFQPEITRRSVHEPGNPAARRRIGDGFRRGRFPPFRKPARARAKR